MAHPPPALPPSHLSRRSRGFSAVEMIIALAIIGLVMAAATRQLIEGVSVTLKTSRLLEHSRSGRNLIGQLGHDLSAGQTLILYPEFNDRSSPLNPDESGNYLVLHQVDPGGTITRTIGYYAAANAAGTYTLYRHDSADGVLAPGVLPATSTMGSHRVQVGTVRLPAGTKLFRNWANRGVSLRGQYGTVEGASSNALNFIQCTLTTRT